MQGFATIDRPSDTNRLLIWLTKRVEPLRADNVNAVSIDLATDARAMDKASSLMRHCALLVTDGSSLDGLPICGEPLTATDIADLVRATEKHQRAIVEAVRDYRGRTRSSGIREPIFSASATYKQVGPADDESARRALSVANYAGRAWTDWLRTEEERRRRTVRPRDGGSPWMMPDGLSSPTVAVLPLHLSDRFRAVPGLTDA